MIQFACISDGVNKFDLEMTLNVGKYEVFPRIFEG